MNIRNQKDRKKGFNIVFYIVLSLFIFTNSVQISLDQGFSTTLVPKLKLPIGANIHQQIIIDGDSDLDIFCSGNGTDGSYENPHIIENFEINHQEYHGFDDNVIELRNITKHLIIRNNTFLTVHYSIKLVNCTNIRITNNFFTKSYVGTILINSNNISIYDNNFSKTNGIYSDNSHNNSITNNHFSESFNFLNFYNSDNNTISSNDFILTDPYDVMTFPGIIFFYSDGNTISNNTISFIQINGIQLSNSSNNLVFNNSILEYGTKCITDIYGENNSIFDNFCGNANGRYQGPNFIGLYVMLGIFFIGGIIVVGYIVVKYLIQREKTIERKGISIISLYVSLVGILVPGLSIIAVILGFIGKKKEGSNKMATAGIVFGFIYTIFQIIMYLLSQWFLAYYLIFQQPNINF